MKTSKRRLISCMLSLALVLSVAGSPSSVEAKAKEPKVEKTMTLKVGQSKTIKITGVKVKKKSFSVTSKKGKKVVSVSKKGKVKAKKVGSAKIKVTIKYKSGKKTKTKKTYVNVKVTKLSKPSSTSKTQVTTKPSSTNNTQATTKPSISTSTPSAKPSETPNTKPTESTSTPSSTPSETPSTKPTESTSTPSAKPSETPSTKPTESTSTPSSTPTSEPTPTPALNINKGGVLVENGTLTRYSGSSKSVEVPEGVTEIGVSAFESQSIESVDLPNTLRTISSKAFKGCTDLEEISCPESVDEVGDLAWSGCTSLKTLSIPNEEAEIGDSIVDGCTSLTEAYIPAKQSGCTHNYMKIKFDATCTAKGKDLSICKDCGNIVDVEVPALGHDAEIIKTDATCTDNGKEQKVCKRCEAVLNVDILPAKGHTEGEYKTEKEPTCTESGVSVKKCTLCNKVLETRIIDPLGHTEGDFVIEKNATCSETGLKVKHCSVCSKRLGNTEEIIEKLPHNYGLWVPVIDPTCVLSGTKQRVCSECGHTDTSDIDLLGHDFSDDYTVDKEATCTEDGSKSQHCSRCDEVQNVTPIPAKGHTYDSGVISKQPTCTEDGEKRYTCEVCGNVRTESIDKINHNWGTVSYSWSDDGKSCTARRVCNNNSNHVETENASIRSSVKIPATCTDKGTTTYTATFENNAFATQTKDVVDIPATGHSYGTPTYTWSADGKTCTATRVCGNNSEHVETENANVTSKVKVNATCTEKGTTTYTATFNNPAFETQTKDIEDIVATGHSYGEVSYTWSSNYMSCTAKRVCNNDSSHIETENVTITRNTKTPATCTTYGTSTYTANFSNSAFATQTKDVQDISALGHNYSSSYTVDKGATCDEEGSKSQHCYRCSSKTNITSIPKIARILVVVDSYRYYYPSGSDAGWRYEAILKIYSLNKDFKDAITLTGDVDEENEEIVYDGIDANIDGTLLDTIEVGNSKQLGKIIDSPKMCLAILTITTNWGLGTGSGTWGATLSTPNEIGIDSETVLDEINKEDFGSYTINDVSEAYDISYNLECIIKSCNKDVKYSDIYDGWINHSW